MRAYYAQSSERSEEQGSLLAHCNYRTGKSKQKTRFFEIFFPSQAQSILSVLAIGVQFSITMDQLSPIEAAIITEQDGLKYSIYDIHTGTSIVNFQNQEPINENCLHVINNLHFITAHKNKLHIWSIYNRRCQDQKLFLPGKPSCLTCSPCGNYLVVGISENIYIWQIHSGYLMSCVSAHYQPMSVLKYNRDGTLLFTGSRDGSVMVWSAADMIAKTNNVGPLNQTNTQKNINLKGLRFIWQNHSAAVTDLEISYGGICVSVSQDASANIYNYNNGKRLAHVVFPSPIHSIAMDKNETTCYIGCQNGNIHRLSLSSLSITLNRYSTTQDPFFLGHIAPVNLLRLSFDGTKLISGSKDNTCKFWDIPRNKLVREIPLQSPPHNLATILVPEGLSLMTMTTTKTHPFQAKPLKRNIYRYQTETAVSSESFMEDCNTTILKRKNINSKWDQALSHIDIENVVSNANVANAREANDSHIVLEKLRTKIDKLYNMKIEELLNGISES